MFYRKESSNYYKSLFQKMRSLDNCSYSNCRQEHKTSLGYGSVMPASIEGFSKKQLKRRVVLTDDLCVVDEAYFLSMAVWRSRLSKKMRFFLGTSGCHLVRQFFPHARFVG